MIPLTIDIPKAKILEQGFRALGPKARDAERLAINHTAGKARTQMKRALVPQTGLKSGTINKALKLLRMGATGTGAAIRSRGGNISLKYFKPKEKGDGVDARPWGQMRHYAGGFLKGGRKGKRVALPKLGGHVFQRKGKARLGIVKVKSGLDIPTEMISGASETAFFSTVAREFPARMAYEILRKLPS